MNDTFATTAKLLRGLFTTPADEAVTDFLERLKGRGRRENWRQLRTSAFWTELHAMNPAQMRNLFDEALRRLQAGRQTLDYQDWHDLKDLVFEAITLVSPPAEADVVAILDWIRSDDSLGYELWNVVAVLQNYFSAHPLTPPLTAAIERLIDHIRRSEYLTTPTYRRAASKLEQIIKRQDLALPLQPGEPWSDRAIADIAALPPDLQVSWADLLFHCLGSTGASPTRNWIADGRSAVDKVGGEEFIAAALRWFPLVELPRTASLDPAQPFTPAMELLISQDNGDVLKGLAWLCSAFDRPEVARALAALTLTSYRKPPESRARCARVGNASIWSLSKMSNNAAVPSLSILAVRIKSGMARRAVDGALEATAARLGVPRDEVEEMGVPAYGLDDSGVRREAFGAITAELAIAGSSTVLRWIGADGTPLKAAPKTVKEQYADDLKELNADAKDIKAMLSAQRERIDALYLLNKRWPFSVWYARYMEHPLVSTIARRLIWRVDDGGVPVSVIWHDGHLITRAGEALHASEGATVSLWHPLDESSEDVQAWRRWLVAHQVQQPFKQAHREIYLLTDAERNTGTYSNRYAAHILKQHQFQALAAIRDWKHSLRRPDTGQYPPTARQLPQWNLRAEFWVEGIGDESDVNEQGGYLYVVTDQVRFYALGGIGPEAARDADGLLTSLRLDTVPPIVLSEVMRDIDLFVGVASVGNDPNWADSGPAGHRTYWQTYAFGDLSETADMRKAVLADVLPMLAIRDRCSLYDRWLVVQGDLRTYRIHLGSANIMMEPDDQYLCIVPKQAVDKGERIFLPFEGDTRLSIILSKAFLLANDTAITDPTILRQIKR